MAEDHPLVGKRIRLLTMPDDPDPIPPGSTGTVVSVYVGEGNWLSIHVKWDDINRSLGLAVPPDTYEILEDACTGSPS